MKKSLRILSLALILVMSVLMLTSCVKKPSGTYSNGVDLSVIGTSISYTFKGNKVTIVTETKSAIASLSTSSTKEGTFKVSEDDDGKMTISFTFKDDNESVTKDCSYAYGTDDNGKDYIKIDGALFYKE